MSLVGRALRRFRELIPVWLLLTVLFPLLLMPLAAIFIFAGKGGFASFVAAISGPSARFALKFSLIMACSTTLGNGILGTYAAYVLTKYRFKGREVISIIINLPVAIPTVVVGTSLLLLWGPIGLIGRYLYPLGLQPMFAPFGVFLAHIFVTFPYMLGAVKPVLEEQEAAYEEVAYTMGASNWQTFRHVIFPALKNGLFTGGLLTFAHSLGEFGATMMVSGNLQMKTQTAPLYIFAQFEAGNIETANAVSAVLAVLSFLLFLFLIRFTKRKEAKGIQ